MTAPETPPEPASSRERAALTPDTLAGTSVWSIAQRALPTQRRHRYVTDSGRHPARMAPDLAARIIHAYTQPGDLVLDPMSGIGTTLVEATHAGRHAAGIECEQTWVDITEENLALARSQDATGTAVVVHADARDLPGCLPPALAGLAHRAQLILTSPPYGPATHDRVRSTSETGHPGITHRRDTYSHRRNLVNLATTTQGMLEGLTQILSGSTHLLHPDGHVVITARPWRYHGHLIDLPSMMADAAENAGLTHTDRCVALLSALHTDEHLQARPSFLQLVHARRARANGSRQHLITHEDVLIFQKKNGAPRTLTPQGLPR